MLKTKTVTSIFGTPVYTDAGDYFGEVEEALITGNKVYGWRIRSTKNSKLSRVLGGAKGVIIPHQFIKAIGDVCIINKAALPDSDRNLEVPEDL